MNLHFIILNIACIVFTTCDPYDDIHGVDGKDTIAFLFEWKWSDVANECEQFLSKNGYAAVRVCVW
jgi:hypothetical protein